jgi:hypothetical protein
VLEEWETLPNEYKCLPYHIVFDVKFDLRQKARLVAGGNFTDPPKEDVYSGVVSMDMIRLGFMLAKMNDLQICTADIGNAFLYGKTSEKCYIIAGPEFGEFQGQKLIIHKDYTDYVPPPQDSMNIWQPSYAEWDTSPREPTPTCT